MSLSSDACGAVLRAIRPAIVVWAVALPAAAMASAAPPVPWTTQTTPGPSGPPDAALTSVSCISATFCMAVGNSDYGLDTFQEPLEPLATSAERWDGSSWTVLPTPAAGVNPELASVSCASATFCVTVGERAGNQFKVFNARALLEMWNGVSWAVTATPAGSVRESALAGVSCVSSTFCMAVGSPSIVWNGSSWRKITIPTAKYHSELSAVSCVAPTACTAVGSYSVNKVGEEEQRPLAERWDGHGWTIDRPPDELDRYLGKLYRNNAGLTAASCLSASFCLASGDAERAQNGIGAAAYTVRWDGTHWMRATAGLPRHSPVDGISCLSSKDCFTSGQFDTGIFPAPSTQQPLVENWNGAKWTRITLPRVPTTPGTTFNVTSSGDPSLSGISCVPAVGCTAVGEQAQGSGSANLAQSNMPGV
jgi:hypothetical protein